MTISDIKRLLSKSFQNTIKNIVSLGDDSTLESDRKPLKIGGKTTPLELSTDNVYVNGQEIDLKYNMMGLVLHILIIVVKHITEFIQFLG